MFKFLKEKLKGAIDRISKKVEEEAPKEESKVVETPKEEVKEKKVKKEKLKELEEVVVEEIPKKKGFFAKIKESIIAQKISEDKFDELFWELEKVLLENNVAVEVIEKIKDSLKVDLVDKPITRGKVVDKIQNSLKESISEILNIPELDLVHEIKKTKKEENRPYVILILGYNGSGKSITAGKLAKYFKDNSLKPILGAGDTFRAAGAIQLAEYAKKVDVPVIKQEMGADSCAVIYDTISSAKARGYDVVIADTAGRIHSNTDLMKELEKIVRVNKPDLKILVIDALTGTDVVPQAKQFDEAVGVDALILTKVDAYEKGGAILSAAYVLDKPILFLGCGQNMGSLKKYDVKEILKNLGLGDK